MYKNLNSFINRYYIFQFLGNMAFFMPVIVLFWQKNGLTMTQIMLLQSIYAVGVSVLELPTGVFADIFGKKNSMLCGTLFWFVGFLWYSQAHLFWQFAIGELVAGIGSAFISGADRSYLHELLKEHAQQHTFSHIEGRARGIAQIAQAVAGVLGGLLGAFSLSLPLVATAVSNIFNAGVVLTFPSAIKQRQGRGVQIFCTHLKESISSVIKHPSLRWYVVFFATFYALLWPLQFYVQVYFEYVRIPVYLYGVLFMGLNLLAGLGMTYTHWLENVFQNTLFHFASFVVVLTLLLVAAFPHVALIPLWSIFMMSVFILQTIVSSRILHIISYEKTATILSLQNLLRRLIYAVIVPFLGIATDRFGLQSGLVIYTIFISLILTTFLLIKRDEFS